MEEPHLQILRKNTTIDAKRRPRSEKDDDDEEESRSDGNFINLELPFIVTYYNSEVTYEISTSIRYGSVGSGYNNIPYGARNFPDAVWNTYLQDENTPQQFKNAESQDYKVRILKQGEQTFKDILTLYQDEIKKVEFGVMEQYQFNIKDSITGKVSYVFTITLPAQDKTKKHIFKKKFIELQER